MFWLIGPLTRHEGSSPAFSSTPRLLEKSSLPRLHGMIRSCCERGNRELGSVDKYQLGTRLSLATRILLQTWPITAGFVLDGLGIIPVLTERESGVCSPTSQNRDQG